MREGWKLTVVLSSLVISGDSLAVDFGRLVMPGPVIAGHAEWETDCTTCHQPLEKGAQDTLCLDCHEEVADDRKQSAGFHGRSPAVSTTPKCAVCHPEHRGREADVLGLISDTFDHRFTDHPLEGAHTAVPCESCHTAGEAYREAPLECVGCHRQDDTHDGSFGDDCADCHDTQRWSGGRFDHDETDFPLRGAHDSVACASCHPDAAHAAPVPTDCGGCHRLDDVHRGRMDPDCATCHGVEKWKDVKFDHGRDTKFPLDGRHAALTCIQCHTQPTAEWNLEVECVSCHQSDDVHAGRNGSECSSCHSTSAWKQVEFDHARDAHFELTGAHEDLRCTQCHGVELTAMTKDPSCDVCHHEDDVHGGKLEQPCDRCHGTSSWSSDIVFDHDVVHFPLLGMHATASCEQCHVSRAFHGVSADCRACHAQDDEHDGALGADCQRCHGPNAWALWQFNHAKETSFALHGAHEDLACSACHQSTGAARIGRSARCVSCHADDDAHFGAFGESCEACHVSEDWKRIRTRP